MNPLPRTQIKEILAVAQGMEGKKVLLAGSSGFLGNWMKEVLSPICEIKCLDIKEGFSITDRNRIGWLGNTNFDFIIHAAGFASPKAYRKEPLRTIEVTIDGTRNLLDLSKKTGARMLFFSSSEIYGNPNQVPTNEWDVGRVACRGPRACYDESKRLAETLCDVYFELYETRVITVRPFNVYGPGMDLNDGRAIPNFVKSILEGNSIEVFGNGNQTRTYCYITDAIKGFLLALQFGRAGRVYNIGNTEPEISAMNLALKVCQIAETDTNIVVRGDTPDYYPADEPLRRRPDISRARVELGFKPQIGLDLGISEYLCWVKEAL